MGFDQLLPTTQFMTEEPTCSCFVLRSHCNPSTTDSTPIMRACSSVGDAKSLSMALVVAARPCVTVYLIELPLLPAQANGGREFPYGGRRSGSQLDSGHADETTRHE